MLSCLLLRASPNKKERVNHTPIIAKKIDLSLRSVAQVGCGGAFCSYSIEKDEECLVFCVSSLLAHRNSTRQHLKVTKCQVISTDANGMQSSNSLSLTKISCIKENKDSLPSLGFIKESIASTLTRHAGAISSEDLILHLGSLKAGTTLEIRLEFLHKFTLPASKDSLQYVFTNRLPTDHLSYSASLAAPLPIVNVTPFHSASNLDNFQWDFIAGSCVVEVVYECRQYSEKTTGFTVQLDGLGSPAGCCTVCLPQDVSRSRSNGAVKTGFNLPCDGLMMLNTSLTGDLLPASVKNKQLHPSEFIFLIDCSGSMGGSSIQAASDTLITCIKSLPLGSYFNVIAFGSNFKHLFHTSSEYTKWSVDKAIQFASSLQASLGGTELLEPLRWIFKQERHGSLAKQVFIVTDGGVNNTQHLLNTVRKNKHQARCHTFGIGPEVCTELVTGIAAASNGRCVLLKETDRLQAKVMEVLQESLEPYLIDSSLNWLPPKGFSLLESTPKSLGTIYSSSTNTAFALLQQEGPPCPTGVLNGSVEIIGPSGDEQVTVKIDPTPLPTLTPSQSLEMASILDKVATWSKLQDMEASLAASSRKNSHNEDDKAIQEPQPKRIKLNGSILNGKMVDSELCNELVELSIASGIPCSLTCFHGNDQLQQLLPHKQLTNHAHKPCPSTRSTSVAYSSRRAERIRKMEARNRMRMNHEALSKPSVPSTPASVSSVALNTFTKLGTTFRNMASSFGLVSPDPVQIPNGHCIDDHLQYQTLRKTQLHFDESRGKIVYPSYYRTNKEPVVNGHHDTPTPRYNGHRTTPSSESSSDDEDFISDTDSNSSLDPDWDNLRQPTELRPLIQMQLYSGAWPMVRAFSYAVGVPLDEVRQLTEKYPKTVTQPKDDDHSNIWTTSLAVCCLEEYFPEFRTEWEVVALKARQWVESECQGEGPSNDRIYAISRSLVTRWR